MNCLTNGSRNSLANTAKLRIVPIVRTSRILRGVWLPAGHHRLTMRYQPKTFLWGAWLNGAASVTHKRFNSTRRCAIMPYWLLDVFRFVWGDVGQTSRCAD